MAKLVLVLFLFKFKIEFEFGFGAARTVGEICNWQNKIILIKATLCSYAYVLSDYWYYNYIIKIENLCKLLKCKFSIGKITENFILRLIVFIKFIKIILLYLAYCILSK